MVDYSILEVEGEFVTVGLSSFFGREFSISKKGLLKNDARIAVDYILNHFVSEQTKIKDLETFGFGSWLIQFVYEGVYIELHELKDVQNGINYYEFDLSQTIKYYNEQVTLCKEHNVIPVFPLIGQKVPMSKDIYVGSEVNGVRYNDEGHMTGWYLTSNSYNGDISTLSVDHLYHLIKTRPEIVKFLALPPGYRFFHDSLGAEVWKDEE